ncbi:MAG: YncE family protein [Chloroflexi bacterium]|nr:MAG: YncE family protein [Chloroflexota bacterium]
MGLQRGILLGTIVLLVLSLALVESGAQNVSPARFVVKAVSGLRPRPYQPRPEATPAVNVYAATMSGVVDPRLAGFPERVYVPNSNANTVDVIDPTTFRVIDHYRVGAIPHHIAPAWDMSRLYVDNEGSSALSVIDPTSGRISGSIPVTFPYNLYFTPDGKKAVVVVERLSRIDFRDPQSWSLLKSVSIPFRGVDHLDFSADGSFFMASTEYTGMVVKVDTDRMEITGSVHVGGLPIDVRLSPDGTVFYVSNQGRAGVSIVDPVALKEIAFLPTGLGAHGLLVSRDARQLYVSNRNEGSVSVIDLNTRTVAAKWHTGGSPDMLQVSPDGSQLWYASRYTASVYVVDTHDGHVLATIRTGAGTHGLTYFPNAGRYSLGHNGVYR